MTNRTDSCPIEVIRFDGPVDYDAALRMQRERCEAVACGRLGEALFLLEHMPVITLGRRARPEHILLGREELEHQGIALRAIERGGDVTYHGPGQMVAYPILDLARRGFSIGEYLRALEDVLIRLLSRHDLPGERHSGYTGVWVGEAKVAAIGIALRNRVTYHGVSLNVDPQMVHFRYIVPCGLADKPVTTMAALLGHAPRMARIMADFEEEFRLRFSSGKR